MAARSLDMAFDFLPRVEQARCDAGECRRDCCSRLLATVFYHEWHHACVVQRASPAGAQSPDRHRKRTMGFGDVSLFASCLPRRKSGARTKRTPETRFSRLVIGAL